ncbi:MAG TPA: DUF418 domain-containing protein [Chloroflexota bacterium]|nr:DUF418 domain-containing protein [Chloroflexota bacterium]
MAQVHPAPTSHADRIQSLDALRGVAILGVLLAYTVWSLGNPPRDTWSRADDVTAWLMDVFVDNKFVTIFACAFGLGVSQQWRRWQASGGDVPPLHLRRMTFLFVIGLLHGVFLRNGDILAPYALLGITLLLFRHVSSRIVGLAIVLLAALPYAAEGVRIAMGWHWPARPETSGVTSYVRENVMWLRYWYVTNPVLSWPRILALMLIGLLIGRAELVRRLATDPPLARRVLFAALPLAVLTRVVYEALSRAWLDPPPDSAAAIALSALYQTSAWPLSASYAAALFLAWQFPAGVGALRPLTFVGRMAFTNYLLQSMIAVPICLAFGWFDRVTPSGGVALAVVIALFQIAYSTWWLRRHAMGPFERLWRRATYG